MDGRLIVQVVVNLVNNAVAYTPPGSTIRVTAARQRSAAGEPLVAVAVADDGPGEGEHTAVGHGVGQGYVAAMGPQNRAAQRQPQAHAAAAVAPLARSSGPPLASATSAARRPIAPSLWKWRMSCSWLPWTDGSSCRWW